MIYQQTTQFPNVLVDTHLPNLTESEIKMILVILRQTNGWVDKKTGGRKTRDWISHGQFMKKTGLCRRVISKSLQSLVEKDLIQITCRYGNSLHRAEDRKGVARLFYSFQAESVRPKIQTLRMFGVKHIGQIIERSKYQSLFA